MNNQWNPNLYYPPPVPPGTYISYQNLPPQHYYVPPYSTPPPNFTLPPPNFLPNSEAPNYNFPPPTVNSNNHNLPLQSISSSSNSVSTNSSNVSSSRKYREDYDSVHPKTNGNHFSREENKSHKSSSRSRRESPYRTRIRSPTYRSRSPLRSSVHRDDKPSYRNRSRSRTNRCRSPSPRHKSPLNVRHRSPKPINTLTGNLLTDERKEILQKWRKNYCSTKEEVSNKLEELNTFNQDEAIENEKNIWTRSTPADLYYERDETNPKLW